MTQFYWGAASAAFQVEGAAREDGKGPSIWDVMTHTPGKTKYGDTGDIACDHYHRFHEDVALMAELGLTAYRFSVAWSRVLPDGTGAVNEKGIRFYSDLIDTLLSHGIEPFLTLYHWDLPQALFLRGGWLNPDSPEWFCEYTRLIGERFGDRVKYFITLNEPTNVIEGMTHAFGNAPAEVYSLPDRLVSVHNLLKAHGRAVQALRETVPDAKIGFAPCCSVTCPADDTPETLLMAKRLFFSHERNDLCGDKTITLFSDPIFLGDYPKEYYEYYQGMHPQITKEDLALIAQPIDFCFHNIYSGCFVHPDPIGMPVIEDWNGRRNMLGWPIVPEVLYWGTKFLYERYKKPIMITENGFASPDIVGPDGQVHDPERVEFLKGYLDALLQAKNDGIDIRGYFYWSIMDNLEWELGFEPRFGLIHVDFETQKRTPKDSFTYYQTRIQKETCISTK